MIQQYEFDGEDFKAIFGFEGWKIGLLRYSDRFSEFKMLERHNETDEVFVLLEGNAILYTENQQLQMQKSVVYNIPKGVWHHITVSKEATVMVVENSNTSADNSERRYL